MEPEQNAVRKQGQVCYQAIPDHRVDPTRVPPPVGRCEARASGGSVGPQLPYGRCVLLPRRVPRGIPGFTVARVQAAERELSPDFLDRDDETNELLLVGELASQVAGVLAPGDKRCKNILGQLEGTHSAHLRKRWADLHRAIAPEIAAIICPPVAPSEGASQVASEGAYQAPSKPVAVAVSVAGPDTGTGTGAETKTAPSASAGATEYRSKRTILRLPLAIQGPPAGAAVPAPAANESASEEAMTEWRSVLQPPPHALRGAP